MGASIENFENKKKSISKLRFAILKINKYRTI